MGASLFKLEGVRRHARDRARAAESTWLAGGSAEERVGEELEGLRAHGFYVFHDVSLPGVGNVDHVVLGERGFFSIETKSHSGHVTARSGQLLRNGRPFEKDVVKQAWSGCYRLRELLEAEVTPLLLFTDAFVEGRITARGVRVLPLKWIVGEILKPERRQTSGP
ncbi:MAG: NERD domain-containing protein [Actinomycetota bacterium]|nr:NERD domain-containing protein [Actinomycetota bacterium]